MLASHASRAFRGSASGSPSSQLVLFRGAVLLYMTPSELAETSAPERVVAPFSAGNVASLEQSSAVIRMRSHVLSHRGVFLISTIGQEISCRGPSWSCHVTTKPSGLTCAIQEFGRRSARTELLFVDDGSRDETRAMLEHLAAANPRRFSFLHLSKNGGKAEAVRQGFLVALRSDAEYVGFWDADLATPLDDIEPFCRVLDAKPSIQLVVGTRIRLLGRKIERRPVRYWLGRAFANTASLALGIRLFDTQCGAKLFRVTPQLESVFEQPFLARWIFDVEILARMRGALAGTSLPPLHEAVYECPLDAWRDVAGSRVKSSDFFKATLELARIYWTYLRPGAEPPLSPGTILSYRRPEPQDQTSGGEHRRAA